MATATRRILQPQSKNIQGSSQNMLIKLNLLGFSLVELIVVLAIISGVTIIGTLSTQNFLSETYLKSSAQDLAITLRSARRLAITKREIYKVVIAPSQRKYWVEDIKENRVEGVGQLKSGIIFANPNLGKMGEEDGIVEFGYWNDNAFSFFPRGEAEAGSIYLKDERNGNWYTLTIVPTTGKVSIYPYKH